MAAPTRKCSAKDRSGRMAKARQFSDAATLISELGSDDSNLGDAYITLCVHAGIAAADVICCTQCGPAIYRANAQELRSLQLHGIWSPRSDSNRRPAVYKTRQNGCRSR